MGVLVNEEFKPIYRLVGKYKNLKMKKKALKYQSMFETRLLGDFLSHVFLKENSEAFDLVWGREEDLLEEMVGREELLYWTRSRDMYTGHDVNEKYKINFYLERKLLDGSVFDEERGRYFDFIKPEVEEACVALEKERDELDKREDLSKKEKGRLRQLKTSIPKKRFTNKCYYLEIGDFNPDFEIYHQKIFGVRSRVMKMVNAL